MENFNVNDYLIEAKELEKLFQKFYGACTTERGPSDIYGGDYINYVDLSDEAKPIQRGLLRRYETWFAVCKLITRQYSDRNEVFEKRYPQVKSHILLGIRKTQGDLLNDFIDLFDEQVNILHTIIPIISLNETIFKKLLTADILDSEIEQAELLFKYNFHRAAGAIAGVVLERYLKTLCDINLIPISEKDTIEPLATKLYKSDKVPDFEKTIFKSIQHLASIRNKCTHPKEEVKQHEIRELLDKVKKITFLSL